MAEQNAFSLLALVDLISGQGFASISPQRWSCYVGFFELGSARHSRLRVIGTSPVDYRRMDQFEYALVDGVLSGSAIGKTMLRMPAVLSEMERELIVERTQAGAL